MSYSSGEWEQAIDSMEEALRLFYHYDNQTYICLKKCKEEGESTAAAFLSHFFFPFFNVSAFAAVVSAFAVVVSPFAAVVSAFAVVSPFAVVVSAFAVSVSAFAVSV